MPWDSGDTFGADRNLVDRQITPGAGEPSRIDLAKDYYNQLSTEADAGFKRNLTDATNLAAEHGQLGSGQLTNRYGSLTEDLARTKELAKRGLVTDATAGTIGDNRSNRAEVRGERDYQRNLAQEALQRRIQQAAMEHGVGQDTFNNALRLWGAGNANNPTGAYLDAAGQASTEAAGSTASIQQLIHALIARRGAQQRAAPAGG
jgi:hypothetical protein